MKPIAMIIAALGAASMTGGTALAGALTETVVEPVVVVPAPVVNTGGDWTGFYGGLQFGYGDVETTGAATLSGDDTIYGLHAGYDYDFGTFVLGGEIDYDKADINLGGGNSVNDVARLKIRGGYDAGRTLLYVTGGAARADTSLGNETGGFYGLGLAYQVSDQFTLGGEVLRHDFNNINSSGVDATVDTFTIRGSFRF